MDGTDTARVRKRLMSGKVSMRGESAGEIDIARHAALVYNFSPQGATFEHEDVQFRAYGKLM